MLMHHHQADKNSNNSLFEKGNDNFGNGNAFDIISGIRRNRPNSPPEQMASDETVPNRRVSPTGVETKVENGNGAKHGGVGVVYPTQMHQDDHAKMAYLSRLQMEVQNARKEVHAAKNAIQIQNARYSNLRPEKNYTKLSMAERLLQHRVDIPMEGLFSPKKTGTREEPERIANPGYAGPINRIHVTRKGSVYLDAD